MRRTTARHMPSLREKRQCGQRARRASALPGLQKRQTRGGEPASSRYHRGGDRGHRLGR
jgi:hypothetical protein